MPKKIKDSYAAILQETREVVKQLTILRTNVRKIKERVGKARDNAEIERIRKQIQA